MDFSPQRLTLQVAKNENGFDQLAVLLQDVDPVILPRVRLEFTD